MRKNWRRLLSMLLALSMVMTMTFGQLVLAAPEETVSADAAEELQQTEAAGETGGGGEGSCL